MKKLEEKLEIVLKAVEDKLGSDVTTLEVGHLTPMADYFVIATGNSVSQTQAIAEEVEHKMESEGMFAIGKEGIREGQWIILDFNDIIVHVFHKDQRDYYNLEKLWTGERTE